jgi:hypothetical protein
MKLPIRTLGLMASALLIGSALSTAVAQGQQSGPDGQVALRSDGALYLIMNGQRRWISTVQLADSDINAIPEGDPIMVGLAPLGSAQAAAPAKPSTGAAGSTAAAPSPSTANASAPKPSPTPASPSSASAPAGDPGEDLSPELPIEVALDGETRIDQGDERRVEIKTKTGFTCELKLVLPGGDSLTEDSKNADSSGKCKYTIQVPDDAKDGDGRLIGTVREGGKVNRQEIAVQIVKKKN